MENNKKNEAKDTAYALMVMLGEIDDSFKRGEAKPVTSEEISQMYEYATILNEYFENLN